MSEQVAGLAQGPVDDGFFANQTPHRTGGCIVRAQRGAGKARQDGEGNGAAGQAMQ